MTVDSTATSTAPAPGKFDAVGAFDSLFGPEEEKPKAAEAKPEAPAEEAEPEGVEAEATADEAEPEAESEEQDEQDEAQKAPAKFTVRVDGEDLTVPLDELLNGYSRTADYTRKTQALATERKSFEQESSQVRAERAEYAQLLGQLRQVATQGLEQEPNWDQLRASDPVQFAIARQEWQMRSERVAKIDAEQQRINALQQADNEQRRQAMLAEQRAMLPKLVPEWADSKAAAADKERIVKAMTAVGYQPEEMQVFDARAMALLRKAALYDEIMANKPDLQKKVAAAPVSKPGRPQKPKSDARRAMDRLGQTGRTSDAAALFEHLF